MYSGAAPDWTTIHPDEIRGSSMLGARRTTGEEKRLADEGSDHSVSAEFAGDLSILDLKTEYRSLKDDPARAFYRPCLLNAKRYKRAVGYFRSSVFIVIGPSLIEFCRRGGRTELICSPNSIRMT